MKAKGTVMVPTLMALEGVRARIGKGIYTPTVEVKAKQAIEAAGRQVTRAKAGGWSGIGTRANGEWLPFTDSSVDLVIDNEQGRDFIDC